MSFFTLSTGQQATATNSFEIEGGGNLEPIPAGTQVLATCEEASVAEWEGDDGKVDRYINLKWRVAKPDEYKNRVLFQKIRVWEDDAAKRDRALTMLIAIDTNCGGRLLATGKEPDSVALQQSLTGYPMILKLDVWEAKNRKGEDISGNWVQAVSPAAAQPQQPAPQQIAQGVPAAPQQPAPQSDPFGVAGEPNIPF